MDGGEVVLALKPSLLLEWPYVKEGLQVGLGSHLCRIHFLGYHVDGLVGMDGLDRVVGVVGEVGVVGLVWLVWRKKLTVTPQKKEKKKKKTTYVQLDQPCW